jgi:formylglycine-generating enzyme required for sulfatase activity
MKAIALFIFIFLPCALFAQSSQVEVYDVQQEGNNLRVFYDLSVGGSYEVSLFYSLDNGSSWLGPARSVSGDAGSGIFSGRNKNILWNVLADRPQLKGNELRFKIRAIKAALMDFKFEMVFVAGGEFRMGSIDGELDEKPMHRVVLSDYFIGKYEVTQKLWQKVIGSNPSSIKDCPECPVEQVSWEDIQDFLKKLNAATGKNYRLPTEAEWEYAARGGSKSNGHPYAGNHDLSSVAWFSSNSGSKIHSVGQKQPNELGLYDMSGNVWEWCADRYGANYYHNRPNPDVNPQGPPSGLWRVFRGGSWNYFQDLCRVGLRNRDRPSLRYHDLGFRLVLSSN